MATCNKYIMNESKYNVSKTRYFLFFIDKRIETTRSYLLMNQITQRYEVMSNFFRESSALDEGEPYTRYIINWNSDGGISGRSYINKVVCNINRQSYFSDMPMIHEEAHLVVYKKWGVLPLFWSEGLSEYVVLKYKNKLHSYLIDAIRDNVLSLDEKTVIDLFCYYSDNMFNYWRRVGRIYSLSACSLFHFILSRYGISLINTYILLIQQGKHQELEQVFRESQVFYQWKESIRMNNI